VRRLAGVCDPAATVVVTSAALADGVRAALPDVPEDHVQGEPVGRNTAAALGLAAVHLLARDPDAIMAALPADHHIGDEPAFRATVDRALTLAETKDAIVTIGLAPTGPETGFGYLELGDAVADAPDARAVARFVEKPDRATAEGYLASGRYLWNGGMFFVRAARLYAEIARHLPALHAGLAEIAHALAHGGTHEITVTTARVYPSLPSISIDHGVMEKASGLLTLPGHFGWNDVGAWSALPEVLPADAQGNFVRGGDAVAHDARGNVVLADAGTVVALVGVDDLVVVRAGDAELVMPRARAQDVKEITRLLEERGLARFL
jgi:mannose-1-phosphate guanylyltransferase